MCPIFLSFISYPILHLVFPRSMLIPRPKFLHLVFHALHLLSSHSASHVLHSDLTSQVPAFQTRRSASSLSISRFISCFTHSTEGGKVLSLITVSSPCYLIFHALYRRKEKVAECFFPSHINGIIEKKGNPIIRNLDLEIRYK